MAGIDAIANALKQLENADANVSKLRDVLDKLNQNELEDVRVKMAALGTTTGDVIKAI